MCIVRQSSQEYGSGQQEDFANMEFLYEFEKRLLQQMVPQKESERSAWQSLWTVRATRPTGSQDRDKTITA
jgi:hypothetical protein